MEAIRHIVGSLSSKRKTFDHLMNDAEVFSENSTTLISFIEERCSDEEKQKLFSGLVEILLMMKFITANEMFRFFGDEKRELSRPGSRRSSGNKSSDR